MNLTAALNIPGFTNPNELQWLAERAQECNGHNIAEIGSWKGRSTRAMADNTTAKIYAVDTWVGTPEDPHMRELVGKDPDWLFNQFIANIGEEHLKGPEYHVRACRDENASLYYSRYLGGRQFQLIFIDAGHSYAAVKEDILAWRPLLAPGGLLCGHDFYPGRGGVIQAVKECCPKAKLAGVGTIWVAE